MSAAATGLARTDKSTPFSGRAVTGSIMPPNPFVAPAKSLRFVGSYPPPWKWLTALLATRTDKARLFASWRSQPLTALASFSVLPSTSA